MRFSWNRGEDGVVTVYGTTSDGLVFDVADFWLQPMMDRLGVSRAVALDYQQQHAELLVTAHNKLFTAADRRGQEPRTDEEMKGDAPPACTNQPDAIWAKVSPASLYADGSSACVARTQKFEGAARYVRSQQHWECPIQNPECTANCGSYGCGN